ncbi:MAG: methyltransferase domain-containing protein [Weeksellaceae bacterium]|jgi:ubiquinone/menaquinone biosynthesis C-methylase UbiE|nr:methyltransferase domain-containing protein [Weeksellaceae bacterium]
MDITNIEKAQGHWILAKMGKRVLRPGGWELTQKLIDSLQIESKDKIVEFAPGMGKTATILIEKNPQTYTGIDADEQAVARLKQKFNKENTEFLIANAAQTPLENASVDKVVGEAMLTMQAEHRKAEIIREAHRILKSGGLYGIHELSLRPDNLPEEIKSEIKRELATSIHVNARPLTVEEWRELLKSQGFKIKQVKTNEMLLLETKRMVEDEGFFRALKIGFNILTHPKAKKRILNMRSVFRKYSEHMNSIMIIAEKM